jgi:hypothetical protein
VTGSALSGVIHRRIATSGHAANAISLTLRRVWVADDVILTLHRLLYGKQEIEAYIYLSICAAG